ncbi:MAG: hypothetical protein Q9178_004452 [Gyalolechia marmorata]
MASFVNLPTEIVEMIISNLPKADLGKCAMTNRRLQGILSPRLAKQLKHLVFANPNVLRLIEPNDPIAYGIAREDIQDLDDGEVDSIVIGDRVGSFIETLFACPMLVKYVKHVFIDYVKLNPCVDAIERFGNVGQSAKLQRLLKINENIHHRYPSQYWERITGLTAMLLLILPNVESLVLLGCRGPVFGTDGLDPIMTAAALASAPGCQQIRLCKLRSVYACGCVDTEPGGSSPWEVLVLPSVGTFECHQLSVPFQVPWQPPVFSEFDMLFGYRAFGMGPISYLKVLRIQQRTLDGDTFYQLLERTPFLEILVYQRRFLGTDRRNPDIQGIHLERFGFAIQNLCQTLEELTIEVDHVKDLWGLGGWEREDDANYTSSEADLKDSSTENDDVKEDDDEYSEVGEVVKEGNFKSFKFTHELEIPLEDTQSSNAWGNLPPFDEEPNWEDQHPGFLGSLAKFERLKVVKLPALALQDPTLSPHREPQGQTKILFDGTKPEATKRHLEDLLPRSIEQLTLFEFRDDPSNLDDDIEDVWTARPDSFPNLTSLELRAPPPLRASKNVNRLYRWTPARDD